MKVSVLNMFEVDGTPEEVADMMARFAWLMKTLIDHEERENIQNEIAQLWNALKGGDTPT